jgi:hypothetical protein
MAAAPELIPEGVELADAAAPLGRLAACIFVLGCLYVVDAFCRALFGSAGGVVGWIPYANKVLESPIHKIEQKVSSALGRAESYFDNQIGVSFHQLARVVDHIGRELFGLAEAAWIVAALALALMNPAQWKHLWATLTHKTGATLDYTKHMAKHADRANRATRAQAIPQTLPKLGRLERELDHVIDHDIAGLRARDRAITDELTKVWHRVKALDRVAGVGVLTGVVALALARLGGSWIRCSNWRRIGRSVCGLPLGLIEELLGATILGFAVTDMCDFAEGAQLIARAIAPALDELVAVENALIGCHGASAPADLSVGTPALPAINAGLPLAA